MSDDDSFAPLLPDKGPFSGRTADSPLFWDGRDTVRDGGHLHPANKTPSAYTVHPARPDVMPGSAQSHLLTSTPANIALIKILSLTWQTQFLCYTL